MYSEILSSIVFDGKEEVTDGYLFYKVIPSSEGIIEILKIEAGADLDIHRHSHSASRIFILEGRGVYFRGDKQNDIGNSVYGNKSVLDVPEMVWHGFHAKTETLMLAIQTASTEKDTEYLVKPTLTP